MDIPKTLRVGLEHHQAGRLAQAEVAYRKFLRAEPAHAPVLHLLALVSAQLGKHENALQLLDRAVAIKPDFAEAFSDRGNVLKELKRADEALASYDRALQIKPDHAEALYNRGVALQELERADEALASYDKAIAVRPNYAEAWSNRGLVLAHHHRRYDEAIASWNEALAIRPDDAGVLTYCGIVFRELGRFDDAVAAWQRVLAIRPDQADAVLHLGFALLDQGDLAQAMKAALHVLQADDTEQGRLLFCECVKYANPESHDPADIETIRGFVLRALAESWTRPAELARPCLSLIARDPAWQDLLARPAQPASGVWPLLAGDRLLLCLLHSAPVPDIEFERLLTNIRSAMLDTAATQAAPDDALACFSAIAGQCFVNEYVFAVAPDELERATRLRDEVAAALEAHAQVQPLTLAIVAAYYPLHSLPAAERLLQGEWPPLVRNLLKQQVEEPGEEARLRDGIPRLTPITEGVSAAVQEQYEQNPYPRWVKAPPSTQAASVDAYLRQQFASASFRELGKSGAVDILVAGCGTGQHAVGTARQFPRARVLAIDLSLASLGYAKRKTLELGLQNLEYAQADILQLGGVEKRFDVIESVGVLHHLADPMQGWRELLALLRPRGFMRLGFYSELARRDIVPAQTFVAERGYRRQGEDIRRSRQALIAAGMGSAPDSALKRSDFFSMSGCRDLLFHVQEQQLTLAHIGAFIAENQLAFIGFQTDPHTIRAYREKFPGDRAMTDLDLWQRFEMEHPATFRGMYQFWVQKPG